MDEGRNFEKLGYESLKKNNIEEAESNFREALKCMEKAGDDTGQAYVLGNLGNIFFQSKQFDKAEDFYSRSLTFMEKLKDAKGIESSLGNLGSVYFYQGSLEKAEESYQKALQIMVETNDPLGQGIYNEYLGNTSLKKDELEQAIDYYQKAKEFMALAKQDERKIQQLVDRVESLKKHPTYLKNKESALLAEVDSLTSTGQKTKVIAKLQDLEELYFQWKRMDKVVETIQKTIAVLEDMADKTSAGICYANLAGIYLQMASEGQTEKVDEAEANFKKALEVVGDSDKRRNSYLMGSLGNIYLNKNQLDLAWEYYEKSLKAMQELGDGMGEARGYGNLGNVRSLQKDWDGAKEQYFKSLELMEKQENRPGIAQQCESLGDIFIKKEEFDQAEDYLMRASDLYEAMKEVGSVQEVQNKLMLIFSQPKYLKNRKQQIREALRKPEAEKDSKLKLALLSDLGNVCMCRSLGGFGRRWGTAGAPPFEPCTRTRDLSESPLQGCGRATFTM